MRKFLSLAAYFRGTRARQEDLAARMGVAQSTISKWVNGQSFPARRRVHKLSAATGVPVERLIPEPPAGADEGAPS